VYTVPWWQAVSEKLRDVLIILSIHWWTKNGIYLTVSLVSIEIHFFFSLVCSLVVFENLT